MSQFYGKLQGKGISIPTKTGTKESGLVAHINSESVGVRVVCKHIDGKDIIQVFKTKGREASFNTNEDFFMFDAN